MMFICLGMFGCIPVLHGVMIFGYKELDDRMSCTWVTLQGTLYIFGALFYAVCHPN